MVLRPAKDSMDTTNPFSSTMTLFGIDFLLSPPECLAPRPLHEDQRLPEPVLLSSNQGILRARAGWYISHMAIYRRMSSLPSLPGGHFSSLVIVAKLTSICLTNAAMCDIHTSSTRCLLLLSLSPHPFGRHRVPSLHSETTFDAALAEVINSLWISDVRSI